MNSANLRNSGRLWLSFVIGGMLLVGCTAESPPSREGRQVQRVEEPEVSVRPRAMWTFAVDGGSFDCTPLTHDEVVYVADFHGSVYALGLDSGATKPGISDRCSASIILPL